MWAFLLLTERDIMKLFYIYLCIVGFAMGFLLYPSSKPPAEPIKAFTGLYMSVEPPTNYKMFGDFDMQVCADELLCDIDGGV